MLEPAPSRSEIESLQLEQLRSLVAELIPANRFYSQKLQDAGVGFDIASLKDFSERFPFTTKGELVADQNSNPPYGTNLTYPLAHYTRIHQTSGTSGAPLRWLDTPDSWEAMIASWSEIFSATDVGTGDRVMFAFSFGPFLGFWLAFESAERLGCLCLPGGGLSSATRLRMMRENKANVLCCTPTYAMRLAEVAAEEKIETRSLSLKTIIVAGEPGGSIPATRAKLESLWPGTRIFDHHGMTEVGPVTYECPKRPGILHVLESAYYTEVVEPNSNKPATRGELILTTLTRTGSPLLRYRTGDIVEREVRQEACSCGSHELALAGGILGRADDMLIVRGVNVYPAAVENIVRQFADVAEFRVHVTNANSMAELAVEIEPAAACADATALTMQIIKAFETAMALRVSVSAAKIPLPRYEMKAARWIKTNV